MAQPVRMAGHALPDRRFRAGRVRTIITSTATHSTAGPRPRGH